MAERLLLLEAAAGYQLRGTSFRPHTIMCLAERGVHQKLADGNVQSGTLNIIQTSTVFDIIASHRS
jgi:hypothetical protein